ncbi:MAG: hypothetical protein IH586_04145 [Anaerolineaceae bacterium]|nr:hypothetical protein [Anaerolineaceae bacterium]
MIETVPQASTSTQVPKTTPEVEKVPTATTIPTGGQDQGVNSETTLAVLKTLGGRLGISLEEIKVLSVEEVQWPDGCLGAGKPDEMCTQAIVDGYRIILQVTGQNYEFHTNLDGKQVREVLAPGPKGGNIITGGAVTKARQFLAQELSINLNEIKLQNAKAVDWPNSCLGAANAGQVCAQVITPGYQIVFEAGGKRYEIHTDTEGNQIVMGQNTTSVISGTILILERVENGVCSRLEAGEKILFGTCGGSLEEAQLSPERSDEFNDLFAAYSPFTSQTKAGKIEFLGTGKQTATVSEQRSVAEWAWIVFQEAQSNSSGSDFGKLISWHREGGIVGFCDDLVIYASGWAYATSCRTNATGNPGYYRLTPQELEQLFTWADKFANIQGKQEDAPGAADSMTITLQLSGTGKEKSTPDQQQEILTFTQAIFNVVTK